MPGVSHSSQIGMLTQCFFWIIRASKAGLKAPTRISQRAAVFGAKRGGDDGLSIGWFKAVKVSKRGQNCEREKRNAENEDIFSVRDDDLGVIPKSSEFARLAKGKPLRRTVVRCNEPNPVPGREGDNRGAPIFIWSGGGTNG